MNKKLPALRNDQAEKLLEDDLPKRISAENLVLIQFECGPKQKSVNLRISD